MTVSAHKATIGRMLWLWVPGLDGVTDPGQAFSANVVYVHQDNTVNITATTHTGAALYLEGLEVHDPAPEEGKNRHGLLQSSAYCTWMPYPKTQMDAQVPKSTERIPVVQPVRSQ
jgi:hypothetical protein